MAQGSASPGVAAKSGPHGIIVCVCVCVCVCARVCVLYVLNLENMCIYIMCKCLGPVQVRHSKCPLLLSQWNL